MKGVDVVSTSHGIQLFTQLAYTNIVQVLHSMTVTNTTPIDLSHHCFAAEGCPAETVECFDDLINYHCVHNSSTCDSYALCLGDHQITSDCRKDIHDNDTTRLVCKYGVRSN